MSGNSDAVLALLFIDLAIILLVARMCGWLAVRLGQPEVIGEIAGGLLLGPGLAAMPGPNLSAALFPSDVRPMLAALANVAVALFMFGVGHELSADRLRDTRRATVAVSVGSVVVPFLSGAMLAWWLYARHDFFAEAPSRWAFSLFISAALTMTALPVLARTIEGVGIGRSRAATVAVVSASLCDLVAWVTLAVVVALMSGGNTVEAARGAALFVALLGVVWFGARPLFRLLTERARQAAHGQAVVLAAVAVGVFLSAGFTTVIGLHAVLGAFVFGVLLPRKLLAQAAPQLPQAMGQFTTLLLPVFFVLSGLSLDLRLGASGLLDVVVVLAIASVSKFAGGTAGAAVGGMAAKEAMSVGVLVNTRGLTELILLSIGLEVGVLDAHLFTVFTVMALLTTIATGPLVKRLAGTGSMRRQGAESSAHANS